MTAPLVIIPCGSAKATAACPPKDLYTSAHFRLGAAAALALTTPSRVLILSARYGLLRYDSPDPITPYDEKVVAGNARRDPSAGLRQRVVAQRRAWDVPPTVDAVALLPRAYYLVARAAFPNIVDVFAGTRGIGDQRARLTRIAEKGRL